MPIEINQLVPDINVKIVTDNEIKEVGTGELLGKGKTVLFGVPGAFTPTCSQAHLPGYVVQADTLVEKGVDQIICMSVNDAFVMKAWGSASHAEKIIMLADGSADLTKALGLEMDASAFGMGLRCCRFAMIIENGKVTNLMVEKPKEFEVSSADYVLKQL